MKHLQALTIFIIGILLTYFIGAVVHADFNMVDWIPEARAFIGVAGIVFSTFFSCTIAYKLYK